MKIRKSSFFAIIILVNGLFFALGMLCATWLNTQRPTSTGYTEINIVSNNVIEEAGREINESETDVLTQMEGISKEDIIGTWYIDAEYTLETLNIDIADLGLGTIGPKTFELKEDGTYMDSIAPASHSTEYIDDYTGTYELNTSDYETSIKLTSNTNKTVEYRIINNKIAYMLVMDGESFQYIYLTK